MNFKTISTWSSVTFTEQKCPVSWKKKKQYVVIIDTTNVVQEYSTQLAVNHKWKLNNNYNNYSNSAVGQGGPIGRSRSTSRSQK